MSQIYETGSRGERLLAEYLTSQGRTVERSDRKTFDLRVDGKYAEVKTSDGPYAKLGFIGLTDSQYRALVEGVPFSVFIVCSAREPAALEVIEIEADELRTEQPKVECTHYWYRRQLERCSQASSKERHPTLPASQPTPPIKSVLDFGPEEAITARIRRLSAKPDTLLYVAFSSAELSRTSLAHGDQVELVFEEHKILGTIKTSGSTPWLSPAGHTSNTAIDATLQAAGLQHGDDVSVHYRKVEVEPPGAA